MDATKQKPAAIRFSRNIGNQDPPVNIPERSIYDFSCHIYNLITFRHTGFFLPLVCALMFHSIGSPFHPFWVFSTLVFHSRRFCPEHFPRQMQAGFVSGKSGSNLNTNELDLKKSDPIRSFARRGGKRGKLDQENCQKGETWNPLSRYLHGRFGKNLIFDAIPFYLFWQ